MSASTRLLVGVLGVLVTSGGAANAQARPEDPVEAITTNGDGAGGEQTPAPRPAPPPPTVVRPAWEVRGFGLVGYTGFAANDTFEAVLDKSGGAIYGGGAMVGHRSGIFVQVLAEHFGADGQRVFVHEGEVFKLPVPLSASVTPIDVTGGYRFLPRPRSVAQGSAPPPRKPIFKPARPRPEDEAPPPPPPPAAPPPPRRWVPYVGGGVGIVRYEETADFAQAGDDVSESFTSYHVLGGIDAPVWGWIGAGVEFMYRWVPDALGDGGVSKEFDETDLGGFAVRFRVTVGK
jgi:hypothetical protein